MHDCQVSVDMLALPRQLTVSSIGKSGCLWTTSQDTYKDRWLESVRRVFAEIDTDGSGTITADEIASSIGTHLSPYEVSAADPCMVHRAPGVSMFTPQQGLLLSCFRHAVCRL